MKLPIDPPPGFVTVPLKGAVLVIPERVFAAGLRLGKTLRRRQAREQWMARREPHADLSE